MRLVSKIKQMSNLKKLLLLGGIVVVALFLALCVQKPEEVTTPPPAQPKELKLSDFPEVFKESTLIVIGDKSSEIELQAVNEITDYLENETGNKPLIKKYSEITQEDKKNNLIVVGTPNSNPMLKEVYAITDVSEVNETFPGEGKGVLEILRNPWEKDKAMLLVEEWDEWGVRAGGFLPHYIQEVTETKLVTEIKPESPVKVNLSLSDLPFLNRTVKLTTTVKAPWWGDLPNVSIEVFLPEGFQVVKGSTTMYVDNIPKNTSIKLYTFIKSIKEGTYEISAYAHAVIAPKGIIDGGGDALFINISKNNVTVSEKRPPPPPLPPMEERTGVQIK